MPSFVLLNQNTTHTKNKSLHFLTLYVSKSHYIMYTQLYSNLCVHDGS